MKTIFLSLIIFALAQEEHKIFNNIGYLATGYNIYKGDPLSSKIDPGFVGQRIFKFSYSKNETTDDLRYKIPDNTDINRYVSCDNSFVSHTITGEKSLTESLK